MCLIVFSWNTHRHYKLVLAGNRDEFFDRPTMAAHRWKDHSEIFGGKDLLQGGSWLAVNTTGRWSTITNYREPSAGLDHYSSRGDLVREFLISGQNPEDFKNSILSKQHKYRGFNLLVGDFKNIEYVSNRADYSKPISKGVWGLSNGALNAPWPKIRKTCNRLKSLAKYSGEQLIHELFVVLSDKTLSPREDLPQTGVSPRMEEYLSSTFVLSNGKYGTRASTVLLVGYDGGVYLEERSFNHDSVEFQKKKIDFKFR